MPRETLQNAAHYLQKTTDATCAVGFDGYVDRIAQVVRTRANQNEYEPVATIAEFAHKIAESSGRNADLELATRQIRMGGNAVLMGNAMATLGIRTRLCAMLGTPPHPVFSSLHARCEAMSLGPCADCTALEFDDGKIMLGDNAPLSALSADAVLRSSDPLLDAFASAELVALVNWAQMPNVLSLWELVLARASGHGARFAFFDLADFSKRTDSDVAALLRVMTEKRPGVAAILGLNLNEACLLADYFGIRAERSPAALCDALAQVLGIEIVVHNRVGAACADGARLHECRLPMLKNPATTVGAGDHFNAGYCLGRLLGAPPEASLAIASCFSRLYVQSGVCPGRARLCEYMNQIAETE